MPGYTLLCTLLGLGLGWSPMLAHGPIPYKYDVLGMRGAVAVWGWYGARLPVGFLVGISTWPRPWWLRGPLCGLLALFPLSLVSLATPACRGPCMFWNDPTGALVGLAVGGLAYLLTGKHHR